MRKSASRERSRRLSAPLALVAVAMAAGVVVDRFAPAMSSFAWSLAAVAAAVCAVVKPIRSLSLFAAFLAIGASWHHWQRSDLADDDLARADWSSRAPAWVRGAIVENPQFYKSQFLDDPGHTSIRLAVAAISDGRDWHPVSGRILLAVTGDRTDLHAGEPVFAAGTLGEIFGPRNPGESDRRERSLEEGIRLRMSVGEPQSVWPDPDGTPRAFDRWLGDVRAKSYELLIAKLDPEISALASALLLGRREGVDPDVNDAFARTGTTHLLAISGLHLQALAVLLFCTFRILGLSRKSAFLGVMIATIAYALLVGLMPSVVRSAAMTVMVCLAGLCGRCSLPANRLAAAAIATMALNPAHLFDAGCQLSFLAVIALFWGVPAIVPDPVVGNPDDQPTPKKRLDVLERRLETGVRKRLRRYRRTMARGLVASFVVWVATLPLVAYHFHIVAPIGVLLNIPLIPITSVALLFAGFTLGFSAIHVPLAEPSARVCGELLRWTDQIVAWGAKRPDGWFFTPGPSLPMMVLFYAMLAIASWSVFRRWRIPMRWLLWGSLGIQTAVMILLVLRPAKPETAEAEVLAVDHGLAVVVQAPDGAVLLYDCGKMRDPRAGRRIIAPALWSRGLRRIDCVILSHADSDHFNGLPDLLDRFQIGEVRVPPGFGGSANPEAARLLDEVRAHGVPIREIVAGDRIRLGGSLSATVLHPPRDWQPEAKDNARSVVLDVESRGKHFLLTGDLEDSGLSQLAIGTSPNPDAMLSPHHGGRTANPSWFYQWANPGRVVVSQKPPQPTARDVFAPLIEAQLPIDRTWDRGALRLRFDASALLVSGFLDPTSASAHSVTAAFPLLSTRVIVAIVGTLVGMLLCLFMAVIEWGAWSLVMPGRRRAARDSEPDPWSSIEAAAADGVRLQGAWQSSSHPNAGTIVMLHGFGEDRSGMRGRAESMLARGWNVAILDSRGRGQSGGTRTAFGGFEADDLRAWLDGLADRSASFVVWGRSMGAAVAVRAAAQDARIAFVILESPFADLDDAVKAFLRRLKIPGAFARPMLARAGRLAGVSLRDPRPIDVAARITVPVLILHGTEDSICPLAAVKRLARAMPSVVQVVAIEGAKHGDVFDRGGDALADQIAREAAKT